MKLYFSSKKLEIRREMLLGIQKPNQTLTESQLDFIYLVSPGGFYIYNLITQNKNIQ